MGLLERVRDWRVDRMADRIARRPHGRKARAIYGAPDAHSFLWPDVLGALKLTKDDRLLDVGCGGGSFLRHVRDTIGCDVQGVDHSADMVRVARPLAAEADAGALPFADGAFTAVSSIAAFFWFPDPLAALQEMHRVLDPARGRIAVCTTTAEAKGTPAAPYPLATRGRFHSDDELAGLARGAGFTNVVVTRPDESGWAQLLTAQP
jgi:ubiquinone/menaquinone biosynthesis C-methylase UbiE